jgi:hypothetical protein
VTAALLVFHLSIRNGRIDELRRFVAFSLLCQGVAAAMTWSGIRSVEGASRLLTGIDNPTADVIRSVISACA